MGQDPSPRLAPPAPAVLTVLLPSHLLGDRGPRVLLWVVLQRPPARLLWAPARQQSQKLCPPFSSTSAPASPFGVSGLPQIQCFPPKTGEPDRMKNPLG